VHCPHFARPITSFFLFGSSKPRKNHANPPPFSGPRALAATPKPETPTARARYLPEPFLCAKMTTSLSPPSKPPLSIPKPRRTEDVDRNEVLEMTVRQNALSADGLSDDADYLEHTVPPLPWRQCAPLIFLASGACYALLYLTIMLVSRL